jgi:hypothetical protein
VEILGRLTRSLDGVVGVINKLKYRWDDTELAAVPSW